MNSKNIFGFLTVGAFIVGGYTLYKYYNHKTSFVQAGADIAKDSMDALDCIANIYFDSEEDKKFCDDVTEIGKGSVDFIASISDENRGWRY